MANVIHRFAQECTFTVDDGNRVAIAWDNGHALEAVTGGAATYIEKQFFIACKEVNNGLVYSFPDQYERLVDGGVAPKLAFIICALRQVASSIEGIRLNMGEVAIYAPRRQDQPLIVDAEVTAMLRDGSLKVNGLLNQTMNILAATGINLMRDGHHYTESETLWSKLIDICMIGDLCENLRLGDWEYPIFHHTFHVYDMKVLATWVTQTVSPLTGKIASVVLIRTPVIPAGATALNLILAMMEPIQVLSPSTHAAIKSLVKPVQDLLAAVTEAPLEYCASFPSAQTSSNLKKVAFYDDFLVFLYGFLTAASKVAKAKQLSVLSAKSLKGKANQHMATFLMGQRLATEVVETETSADDLKDFLKNLVNAKLGGIVDEEPAAEAPQAEQRGGRGG